MLCQLSIDDYDDSDENDDELLVVTQPIVPSAGCPKRSDFQNVGHFVKISNISHYNSKVIILLYISNCLLVKYT